MSQNLAPGRTVNLADLTGAPKLIIGCGWEAKQNRSFLDKLLKKPEKTVDLDFSCIVYNKDHEFIDTIWYTEMKSKDNAIHHSGDETTGETEGDDEQISVDLMALNPEVQSMVFTISSFSGTTFEDVDDAYVRIIDDRACKEVLRMRFRGRENVTAKIMFRMRKDENGAWQITALNKGATGANIHDLYPQIRALLWM